MLDLRGVMWYNATTSGRFFFFAIKTGLKGLSTYRVVLFVRLKMWCMTRLFKTSTEGGVYFYKSKSKKYFRKAGGAVMRVKITLACTECKQRNYNTMKNKKNDPDRLEMNKYCRFCKKHTLHKETK